MSHAELMIFGALIVWFLIVEPHGLALWSTAKQKLRLWPFPHRFTPEFFCAFLFLALRRGSSAGQAFARLFRPR